MNSVAQMIAPVKTDVAEAVTVTLPQTTNERYIKGVALYEAGAVEKISPDEYAVNSQTDASTRYIVNLETLTCTCPDHQQRGMYCKHMVAARRCDAFDFPHDIEAETVSLRHGVATASVICGCGRVFTASCGDASAAAVMHIAHSFALKAYAAHIKSRLIRPVCK